ncbi:MAG: hypothetical protein ABIJ21_02440 [Nanoarchaeota archaeon]
MYSRPRKITQFINSEGSEIAIYYKKGSYFISPTVTHIENPELQVYVDDYCRLEQPLSRNYDRNELRFAVHEQKRQWRSSGTEEILQDVENLEDHIP